MERTQCYFKKAPSRWQRCLLSWHVRFVLCWFCKEKCYVKHWKLFNSWEEGFTVEEYHLGISSDILQFLQGHMQYVMRLDQSYASKDMWWIMIWFMWFFAAILSIFLSQRNWLQPFSRFGRQRNNFVMYTIGGVLISMENFSGWQVPFV